MCWYCEFGTADNALWNSGSAGCSHGMPSLALSMYCPCLIYAVSSKFSSSNVPIVLLSYNGGMYGWVCAFLKCTLSYTFSKNGVFHSCSGVQQQCATLGINQSPVHFKVTEHKGIYFYVYNRNSFLHDIKLNLIIGSRKLTASTAKIGQRDLTSQTLCLRPNDWSTRLIIAMKYCEIYLIIVHQITIRVCFCLLPPISRNGVFLCEL